MSLERMPLTPDYGNQFYFPSMPYIIDEEEELQEYSPYENYWRQTLFSYVRFLHAAPGVSPVDVYINDDLVARNLTYRNFTGYLKLPTGLYNIRIFPAGTQNNPIISGRYQSAANSINTLAAIGKPDSLSILTVPEPVMSHTPGTSLIRYVHLSPDSPPVDITFPDGRKLFSSISYKEISPYTSINPGTYTFQQRAAASGNILLVVPNAHLLPNRIYSIYGIGLYDGNPSLQVLIPLDGSTYLKF